jgi:uncharacterized protein YcfJ
MINKCITLFITIILNIGFVQTISAQTIRGLVTLVHPVYDNYTQRTPFQHCYTKKVFIPSGKSSNTTPTIAGGIVGGVIGNQFGKGNGKTILTVAGALLGSSIGNDLGHSNNYSHTQNVKQCETRYTERMNTRIQGYNIGVTIPNGRVITTFKRTPYNPPRIHSQIDVYVTYNLENH